MTGEWSSFYNATRDARKLIVVDLGFLGDSVHLVPALWELKRHHPAAEIHTLSATLGAEVLKMVPCVTRAWGFPLGGQSPPWWRHWGIIRELRRQKFDLAINFSGADRTVFLTALTGAKWRLGHPGGRWHFWSRWLIPTWTPKVDPDLPIYEQRRQVLSSIGCKLEPARFGLTLPTDAVDWAEKTVPAGSIHFSVNASSPFKEWPLAHWATLAKELLADPTTSLVATGSSQPREVSRLKELAALVADPRLKIFAGGISVPQLAALLARCRLHLGSDSGVTHLALALGLPTSTIFRDYAGRLQWAPRGEGHRHICRECRCDRAGAIQPDCTSAGTALCLAAIEPAEVLRELVPARSEAQSPR